VNVAVAQWRLLLYSDDASHKATRTESEKKHGLGTRMSITMSKVTDSLTRRGTDIEGNMVLAHFVTYFHQLMTDISRRESRRGPSVIAPYLSLTRLTCITCIGERIHDGVAVAQAVFVSTDRTRV